MQISSVNSSYFSSRNCWDPKSWTKAANTNNTNQTHHTTRSHGTDSKNGGIVPPALQQQAVVNAGIEKLQTMYSNLSKAALEVTTNGVVPPEMQRRIQVRAAIAEVKGEVENFKANMLGNTDVKGLLTPATQQRAQMMAQVSEIEATLDSFEHAAMDVTYNGFVPAELQRKSQVGSEIVRMRAITKNLQEMSLASLKVSSASRRQF